MAHLPSFLSGFAGALRETVAFTFLSRESAAEPSSLLRKNSSKGSLYEEIMTGGPPSPSSKSRSSQSPPNRKHRLLKALHSSTSAPADEDVERICGQTLYERLGGEEGMITAMQLFYDKVVADPKIGRFFEDVNMTRQKYKAKLFLTMIFDGPYEFIGEGLHKSHRRLVQDMGLDATHFDALSEHLRATLGELNVPSSDILDVMKRVYDWRDCVLGLKDWA